MLTRSLGRVVAPFAAALIGCSTAACGLDQAVRHEVRITIKDPTKRLGAPPWHVEVGAIGEGMASAYASPDSPFRGAFTQFRGTSDHLLTARSRSQEIALNIPALGRGEWQGIVRVSYVGTCEGHARFVDLGPPDPEAETLFLRGTAWPNPNGNGWYLDLRTEIPAAPTPEVIMAKRARRLARIVPRPGTCNFGGVEGLATVPLEHDARFAVLVNGDDKYRALKRPWMEALVRAGGCAVVDHTRIDAALQQRLAHSPTSAPVLQEVSRAAGATMVFMLDQKTGMAHLIEVATAEVPMQWPIDE